MSLDQQDLFSQVSIPQPGDFYVVDGNPGNVIEVVSVSESHVTWTRQNNNCYGRNYETALADWAMGISRPGHIPADLQRVTQ
ncbi:hypothetical protein GGR77_001547 [Xanthomonas translucens]